MIEFGQKLRKKRESKGITLEEISVNTNISVKYLRAIESGDMSQLPESFMKLFMKSYASEIGVNLYLDVNFTRSKIKRHQSNLFDSIDDVYPGQEIDFQRDKKKKKKHKDVLELKKDSNEGEVEKNANFSDSSIFSESFDENDMSNLSIFMEKDETPKTFEDFLNENKVGVFIFISIFLILILSFSAYYFLQDEEETSNEIPLINVITVSDSEGEINVNIRDSVYFEVDENSEDLSSLYADSLFFELVASDTCYVIHYNDESKIIENTLYSGDRLLIKGGNVIEMKLGKLEVLSFKFNGNKVKKENVFKGKKGTAYLKISRLYGTELIKKSKKIVDYLKATYGNR